MSKKWFDTGCLRAQPKSVDTKAGVICGVKVCTEGEAKGHGVHLDKEFIDTVAAFGAGLNQGLKARFGHPNMCSESLGTYLGRFKNFSVGTSLRDDGTSASTCFADLHLSETAHDTPNGDLAGYVMSMAENEADVFGTSIVFTAGLIYRRNEAGEKIFPYDVNGNRNEEYRQTAGPDFIECAKLHACDCVDDPAANDGLFSAFGAETVAGQITEFLDLNPQVFTILADNQQIVAAIAEHGERFDQFLTRYTEYRKTTIEEATMPEENKQTAEELQEVEEQETAASAPETEEKEELSVNEAVQKALAADRKRAAQIEELGNKFGFADDARKFRDSGKSVEEFRVHILGKTQEQWKSSLGIKNPAAQETEGDQQDLAAGQNLMEQIKAKRNAK